MIVDFITKPTQGEAFKISQYQFMVITESQEPCPGNLKKYCEDKLSKHGQKAALLAAF